VVFSSATKSAGRDGGLLAAVEAPLSNGFLTPPNPPLPRMKTVLSL